MNIIKLLLIQGMILLSLKAQEVTTLTNSFAGSGGVAVNNAGELFVADFGAALGNARGVNVWKVLKDGKISLFANGLSGASGNAFDSKGNLFQSNISAHKLSMIKPDGTTSTFASSNLQGPVGVAIGRDDTIYVANCGGNSISRITPDGESSIWASSFLMNCPNGLAMDDEGNLYTCNFNNGRVIKIDGDKHVSVLANLPTDRCGHLTYANGRLYVVGRCSNSIYEVLLNGDYKKIAGTGNRGNNDGPVLEATFNHPNGIDASPDGDTLYINDCLSTSGDCLTAPLNPVVVRMITGVKQTLTSVDVGQSSFPAEFVLHQNYPNPFNPSTEILYNVPENENVSLVIYNSAGRKVRTLINKPHAIGSYSIKWNGKDDNGDKVSSGIYIYSFHSGKYKSSRKMVLLK